MVDQKLGLPSEIAGRCHAMSQVRAAHQIHARLWDEIMRDEALPSAYFGD